jgi:RsiW-degrading membrane proteinase PrsW (M82 family)
MRDEARCVRCGEPLPPGAMLCPRCLRPVEPAPAATSDVQHPVLETVPVSRSTGIPPQQTRGRKPTLWDTVHDLIVEYASLDTLSALLRSPKFWLLYSLAAMPVVFQWIEIGAQGMFFYFSFFWAVVFHRLVAPEPGTARLSISVYLATAFVVLPALVAWIQLPPYLTNALIRPGSPLLARLAGFIFGVGIREELAKASPVFFVLWMARRARRRFSLRQGLFLGAVSGLAFAAMENLEYLRQFEEIDIIRQSMGFRSELTFEGGVTRLLLTPFMHGAWAGITGYFLAWGEIDRPRRRALQIAGLLLAAIMHGTYNAFAEFPLVTLLAIGFAFHVLAKCIARATAEDVAAVPERV